MNLIHAIVILKEQAMVSTQSKKNFTEESKTTSFSKLKANCGIAVKQISGKLVLTVFVDEKGEPANKMYSVRSHKFYLKKLNDRMYAVIKLKDLYNATSNIEDLYPHRHLKNE